MSWMACLLGVMVGCDNKPLPSPSPRQEPMPAKADATPAKSPALPEPPAARTLEKTFDDLQFDIAPDAPFDRSLLTNDIESLFGKRIRIRGYILPTFQRTGIRQFVLVRDNLECCFGPGAALFDCIVVDMVPGESTNFSVRPVAVEGTLTLEELIGPEGNHLAIFHLAGEQVK